MKNTTAIFPLILLLGALLSCEQPVQIVESPASSDEGSFALSFRKSAVPSGVTLICAELTRANHATITDSASVNSSSPDSMVIVLQSVPPGTWSLRVLAKDADGFVLYSGTASILVIPGRLTVANVEMQQNTGSVGINLIWPSEHGPWVSFDGNPVLYQSSGEWDEWYFYIQKGWVLRDAQGLHMWYHAGSGDIQEIAYATSQDGLQWEKHGIVISRDPSVDWMLLGASSPSVLKEDGVFKMWFNGKASVAHAGIGYAMSNDGVHWEIRSSQVIALDSSRTGVFAPSVVRTTSGYEMFFSVETMEFPGAEKKYRIHRASSGDGIHWQESGTVLSPREWIPWEGQGVVTPFVLKTGSSYVMYYTGYNAGTTAIGKASSSDGLAWQHDSESPEFSVDDVHPWNVSMVGHPSVLIEDGKTRMWFSALSSTQNNWQIGYAERQ